MRFTLTQRLNNPSNPEQCSGSSLSSLCSEDSVRLILSHNFTFALVWDWTNLPEYFVNARQHLVFFLTQDLTIKSLSLFSIKDTKTWNDSLSLEQFLDSWLCCYSSEHHLISRTWTFRPDHLNSQLFICFFFPEMDEFTRTFPTERRSHFDGFSFPADSDRTSGSLRILFKKTTWWNFIIWIWMIIQCWNNLNDQNMIYFCYVCIF